MQKSIVDMVEAAMEVTPTPVLAIWSHAYAEAEGNTPGVRCGVRNDTDWEVELAGCSTADAHYIEQKYGVDNVHYTVDDDSVTADAFAQAMLDFMHYVAPVATPLTCSLGDVIDFIMVEWQQGDGNVTVRIGDAEWVCVR